MLPPSSSVYSVVDVSYSGPVSSVNGMAEGCGTAFRLVNGEKEYEGEWKSGRRHGQGTSFDEQGQVLYSGAWRDNLRHGVGTYQGPTFTYEGEWRMGLRFGRGKLTVGKKDASTRAWVRISSVLEGEFCNNLLHGAGERSVFREGKPVLTEKGTFEDDLLMQGCRWEACEEAYTEEGAFVRFHADDRSTSLLSGVKTIGDYAYRGDFPRRGINLYGAGTMTFCPQGGGAQRLVYQGNWRDGEFHGEGVLYHVDGTTPLYSGSWRMGESHGEGEMYYPDGSVKYRGSWGQHRFHGIGALFCGEGRGVSYVGMWENGARCGKGISFFPGRVNCIRYVGTWLDDLFHGNGTEMFDSGMRTKYQGEFVRGKYHGQGTLSNESGQVLFRGCFERGQAVSEDWMRQKREREEEVRQVVELHERCAHLASVPTCPLCLDPMMHGDVLYVYNQCGHRVCACLDDLPDHVEWNGKCMTCKTGGQKRIRLF